MEKRAIERAWLDEQRTRQASVALAARTYYEHRRGELSGEIAKASCEILRDVTPERRADLETRLNDLYRERRDLDKSWKHSSIRRAMAESGESAFAVSPIETRGLPDTPSYLQQKAATTGTKTAKTLSGYAAKFGKWSLDLGGWKERLAPGCFADALKKSDPVCLFNHDANLVLGRSSSATLECREDAVGLWFTCSLIPFDSMSYGLARRIDRRDIHQCSFAFTLAEDSWEFATKLGDLDERTVLRVERLYDVSPVTRPAYPDTACEVTFEEVQRAEPDLSTNYADWEVEDQMRDIRLASLLERLRPHSPQYKVQQQIRKAEKIIDRCRQTRYSRTPA